MDTRPCFDKTAIHSVELNLLDGQVDLILRSLELYSYNLEFMLNAEESDEEKKREKLAQLKYTYEQVLSSLAEQVCSPVSCNGSRRRAASHRYAPRPLCSAP